MELTAPGKLAALLTVVLGCFVYIIVSLIQNNGGDTTPAWATVTLISGYLIGNGTGARKGISSAAVWAPAGTPQASADPGPKAPS